MLKILCAIFLKNCDPFSRRPQYNENLDQFSLGEVCRFGKYHLLSGNLKKCKQSETAKNHLKYQKLVQLVEIFLDSRSREFSVCDKFCGYSDDFVIQADSTISPRF